LNRVLDVDEHRFSSRPSIIYLLGTLIFLVLFILEKTTHILSATLNADCCCLKKYMPQSEGAFSCNIFAELRPEAILSEINQARENLQKN